MIITAAGEAGAQHPPVVDPHTGVSTAHSQLGGQGRVNGDGGDASLAQNKDILQQDNSERTASVESIREARRLPVLRYLLMTPIQGMKEEKRIKYPWEMLHLDIAF